MAAKICAAGEASQFFTEPSMRKIFDRAVAWRLALALTLAAGALNASLVLAAYPDKPLRLVVPFPPGGGTAIIARALGAGMSQELGQPVIIDNKPGAGTIIGTDA